MSVNRRAPHPVAAKILGAVGVEHPKAQVRAFHSDGKQSIAAHPEMAVTHLFGQLRKFRVLNVRQMNEREIIAYRFDFPKLQQSGSR